MSTLHEAAAATFAHLDEHRPFTLAEVDAEPAWFGGQVARVRAMALEIERLKAVLAEGPDACAEMGWMKELIVEAREEQREACALKAWDARDPTSYDTKRLMLAIRATPLDATPLQDRIKELEATRCQEDHLHPDWSMLEAGRASLREHFATIKDLRADLTNSARVLAETQNQREASASANRNLMDRLKEEKAARHAAHQRAEDETERRKALNEISLTIAAQLEAEKLAHHETAKQRDGLKALIAELLPYAADRLPVGPLIRARDAVRETGVEALIPDVARIPILDADPSIHESLRAKGREPVAEARPPLSDAEFDPLFNTPQVRDAAPRDEPKTRERVAGPTLLQSLRFAWWKGRDFAMRDPGAHASKAEAACETDLAVLARS